MSPCMIDFIIPLTKSISNHPNTSKHNMIDNINIILEYIINAIFSKIFIFDYTG